MQSPHTHSVSHIYGNTQYCSVDLSKDVAEVAWSTVSETETAQRKCCLLLKEATSLCYLTFSQSEQRHSWMESFTMVQTKNVRQAALKSDSLDNVVDNIPADTADKDETDGPPQALTGQVEQLRQRVSGALCVTELPRKEGRVFVINPENHSATERTYLLFSDKLAICSERRLFPGQLPRYNVQHVFTMTRIEMIECFYDDEPYTLHIRDTEVLEFRFQTSEERQEWQKPVLQLCAARQPGSVHVTRQFNTNSPHSELGLMVPVLVRHDRATLCPICLQKFALQRKKYHCQLCGRVACWWCLTHKVALPYSPEQRGSVCKPCIILKHEFEAKQQQETLLSYTHQPRCVAGGGVDISRSSGRVWDRRYCAIFDNGVFYFIRKAGPVVGLQTAASHVEDSLQATVAKKRKGPFVVFTDTPLIAALATAKSIAQRKRWLEAFQGRGKIISSSFVDRLSRSETVSTDGSTGGADTDSIDGASVGDSSVGDVSEGGDLVSEEKESGRVEPALIEDSEEEDEGKSSTCNGKTQGLAGYQGERKNEAKCVQNGNGDSRSGTMEEGKQRGKTVTVCGECAEPDEQVSELEDINEDILPDKDTTSIA